jgi:hypothetical protein
MANAEAVVETINVAELTEHKSKKGARFWKAVTTDGEYYTIWKDDIKDRMSEGINTVTVEHNNTGDKVFHNIVGIAAASASAEHIDSAGFLDELGGATPPPQRRATPTPLQNPPQHAPSAQVSSGLSPIQMARAMGLQAAAAVAAAGVIGTQQMVAMAERNARYILDGPGEQQNSSVALDEYIG